MLSMRSLLVIGLLHCIVCSVTAQSTIIGLRFNNQTVTTVKLTIIPPGSGGNKSEAKVGDAIASGCKLIIPVNTIVLLQSPGGKQKLSSTTGKPFEYTLEITSKGENHVVQGVGAQIKSSVEKTVGYNYRVNNGKGTTAASKGTEFTFTDLSEGNDEKATITTTEGSIRIIDQVPCTINGEPVKNNRKGGVTTKSVSETQTAGDAAFVSSDQPLDYGSLDAAIAYIKNEINGGETDPEDIADDLMCLGTLYMDMQQPDGAIKAFSQAAEIYESEYGSDDLTTIEARLNLADALASSGNAGNQSKGENIANEMINMLLENLSYDKEDLEYVKDENDEESAELICDDIIDTYSLLGWAYDIKGDTGKSDEYYDLMDKGCE